MGLLVVERFREDTGWFKFIYPGFAPEARFLPEMPVF
jgi:hypothetical protein